MSHLSHGQVRYLARPLLFCVFPTSPLFSASGGGECKPRVTFPNFGCRLHPLISTVEVSFCLHFLAHLGPLDRLFLVLTFSSLFPHRKDRASSSSVELARARPHRRRLFPPSPVRLDLEVLVCQVCFDFLFLMCTFFILAMHESRRNASLVPSPVGDMP